MHTLEYAQECSLRGMLMKQLTNIAGNVWPPRRIEWIIQRYVSQMVRKSETSRGSIYRTSDLSDRVVRNLSTSVLLR